ncbi:MAG: fmtA [Clostridiales bacterium]|jgi:CubicO group peptidase (beta-lactamase class C family)/ribosomal protein S18 acetylase RimI-like enzyme|nr:fmtA [Clostridiales bacterium]
MNIDKQKFSTAIDEIAKKWDISGGFIVSKDGEILHDNIYGFADREKEIPTRRDCTYSFQTNSIMLLGICLMQLVQEKKIKLSDKLSKYIPEYKYADKIKIKNLVKINSGIPDFYFGKIMVELDKDMGHNNLQAYDKMREEKKAFYENNTFKMVLQLIGEDDLEFEPEKKTEWSESNAIFIEEVIERVSGMNLYAFEKKNIFEPLEMTATIEDYHADTVSYGVYREKELVQLPLNFVPHGVFTTTFDDLKKLMNALSTGKLISKKLWDTMLKYDNEGRGICFENANGMACGEMEFMGFQVMFYFDQSSGLCYTHLSNEKQIMKNIESTWRYFRKDAREEIEALFTYPMETKMIRCNKKNIWNALAIKVDTEQLEYVLEAKSSIAMCLVDKNLRAFVEMEGNRAIGLLILELNKKKDYYAISIIQIDRRFQGRGYGKIMLKWAVEYLKNEGAKELEIGVNRFNIAAQKLYLSVGFSVKAVYEEGMTLHMEL